MKQYKKHKNIAVFTNLIVGRAYLQMLATVLFYANLREGFTIYQIQETVADQIKLNLSVPETGGILGADIHDRFSVTEFYFDSTGRTGKNTYTPDVEALNKVIAEWAKNGIEFVGFVHSHSNRSSKLSQPDIEYANKIKSVCGMPEILMMIYLPETKNIYQYVL